jgi:predicted  nucleic acid-binding Zn-ribbon protein
MSDHHPEQVATPPGEAIALSPEDALQRWPNTIAETKRLLASEEDLPDRSEQEAFLRNLEDRLVKLKGLVEEDKRLEKLIESTEGKGKSTVSKSRERNTTYISWVLDPAVERRDKDREALRSRNRRAEEKRAALAVRPPAQSSAMVAVSHCCDGAPFGR